MIVMKFGGASLSTALGIKKVCKIVKEYWKKEKIVLVVSAMLGVTDMLFEVVSLVKQKNFRKALSIIEKVKKQHIKTLYEIDKRASAVKVESDIINLVSRLSNFVKNLENKEITLARIDYIVSFGERMSALIVANALEINGMMSYPIDASYVIVTNSNFGNAVPLFSKSQKHINKILFPLIEKNIIPVVTGYIGFTHDGCTTTLGRGGSDLTAAYLSNLLNAKSLYLWKDVEGFFDFDPHQNKKAKVYSYLSYSEAKDLAKNGAKIIYYKAIDPVKEKEIKIYIKSFISPKEAGTVIFK